MRQRETYLHYCRSIGDGVGRGEKLKTRRELYNNAPEERMKPFPGWDFFQWRGEAILVLEANIEQRSTVTMATQGCLAIIATLE